jgi:hypothetical protein
VGGGSPDGVIKLERVPNTAVIAVDFDGDGGSSIGDGLEAKQPAEPADDDR